MKNAPTTYPSRVGDRSCCVGPRPMERHGHPRVAQQLVSFYDSALGTKYDEAFNIKDAVALAALFTEDAVLVTPEGLFPGRQAIEKRYAGMFKRSHLTDFFGVRDQLNAIGNELWAVGEWWSLLQTEKGPVQSGATGQKFMHVRAMLGRFACRPSTLVRPVRGRAGPRTALLTHGIGTR